MIDEPPPVALDAGPAEVAAPAPPSALRKLLLQTSHYSLASLLTLVGGLITFPLLTRLFSVADYGLMSLVSATLGISVAIGKTGVQHAIVRYFTEIAAGKSRFSPQQLHSTALLGMAGGALVVMLGLALAGRWAPESWLHDQQMRRLLTIVSVLVVVEVLDSGMTNFLRADQNSAALMKYQIVKKYIGLGSMLFAVLVISPTLASFYRAQVFAEITALGILAWLLFGKRPELRPRLEHFSRPLYGKLLAFGLPMVIGYELSGLVLSAGDRYVIRAMIGETEVGLYSAAYTLCEYVQSVFISSIGFAIMPLYMRMWDEEGAEKTSRFVSESLRNYVLLAAPLIAGVAAVGPELLPSLASEKYAGVGQVLPWVMSGMIVDGIASFVGAGLFVQRKTRVIMAVVFGSAVANIALNVVLVPHLGIVGAAVATLGSYGLVCLGFGLASRQLLPVRVPWATILRASLAALGMFGALHVLCPGRRFITVGIRVLVGAPLYLTLVCLIDAHARSMVQSTIRRLRQRLSGG